MAIPKVGLRKIKRKEGYVYQIDYTIDGERIREVIGPNKSEAEDVRTTIRTDLIRGKLGVPKKKTKITLNKLYTDFVNVKQNTKKLSNFSLTRYKNYYDQFEYFIKECFPHCLIDITLIKTHYITESIERFTMVGTRDGKKWANSTANGYKDFLASLFKYAIKTTDLTENPASGIADQIVNKKTNAKFYSDKEIETILEHVSDNWQNFINFILNTGLRQGEMEFLPWKHVDFKNEFVLIAPYNGWCPKKNKTRTVYLNDTALSILKSQMGKNDTRVFTNDDGSNLYKNQSYKKLKPIIKKLGIEGDVHKFRHTFASNFIMSDSGDIYDLLDIMGHDDVETTQIYANLSPNYLKKRMKNLDKKK